VLCPPEMANTFPFDNYDRFGWADVDRKGTCYVYSGSADGKHIIGVVGGVTPLSSASTLVVWNFLTNTISNRYR